MKILHVVRQFYPCIGGVENFVYCLAREQTRARNTVQVLTLDRNFRNDSPLSNKEDYNDIAIKRIPFWGSKRYPIALSCIRYLKDYDVVHIHCIDFFVDYLVFLKFLHKKRTVLHTHGGFFHTNWLMFFKKVYFNTITRLILKGCDKVIASSKPDYDLFSKISRNIVHIDNGVDVERYSSIKKNIEYGTLLYIGRIDEHKRIDILIKITSLLVRQGYEVKLKIVGPNWRGLKSKLQALAGQLGIENKVLFFGQIREEGLVNELSKAHIFVSASTYEAFGISAVEAMASGTVCVLNRIEAFKQFIAENKCGILVEYEDSKKAADSIMKVLNMNKERYLEMGMKAKEAAKQYSWDSVAKKIFSVYEQVLQRYETS